jgi:Flp pilus assembly protein TadD/mono/diheme cytochrome c family protein
MRLLWRGSDRRVTARHGVIVLLAAASLGTQSAPADKTPRATFAENVAPILFEHCAGCHRPGGSAPFPLLSYGDARPRAAAIANATARRVMPPWLPARGDAGFVGERRLTTDQISTFRRWVESGAPEGDVAQLPSPPTWHDGWQFGQPDLVVEMDEPFVAPAGTDLFRNFVLTTAIARSRYVRAVELLADDPTAIHHASLAVDRTRWSRYRDAQEPEPGYDGMLGGRAVSPAGHFIGWTPGRTVRAEPEDMAWRLDPGTDLVVQVHLMPRAEKTRVRIRLGLFFADRAPTREATLVRVGPKNLDIPAESRAYVAHDSYVLPVDVDLLSVYPHAHYLAHRFLVVARLPEGGQRTLLDIPAWDFHWQDEYRFRQAIVLPRGTVIDARVVYDNSSENRSNPSRPPVRVVYGPRSTDEMCDVWFQVVARTPGDRAALERDFASREAGADVSGLETLVRARPGDTSTGLLLGTMYSRAGRPADAERQYRRVLELNPSDWLARYDLGALQQARNRLDEAKESYLSAERANPDAAEVQHALGTVEFARGRLAASIVRYERALAIWPQYADAHVSLATSMAKSGHAAQAIAGYRRALAIDPDHLHALNNLAILLASTDRLAEALPLLRHAVEIAPDDTSSRTNLDAALRLANSRPPRSW